MAVGYVDCHCHMTAEEFSQDTEEVIEESRKEIQALISVTEHGGEFEKLIYLSDRYPNFIMPCFGIHPIQNTVDGQRSVTMKIGLDFTPWLAPTSEQREEQLKVFQMQLEMAKRMDLPVNVHSRSAGRQTVSFLKEQGSEKVLLHNFAGRPSTALEGVQAGYFFSFPPAVIRNEQRAKLIKKIPLENICLETDSPSLGPKKEERNVPSNICHSCEYIASIKGLTAERVREVTTLNALRLFPKVFCNLQK
ncbi:hypothetical protein XENTR_v10013294 [Xenopus tropicalis]|uniref:Deoxyribonuclease tatdn3-A isoform X2 n=1 Tax=Xenopus tropicalis TaxID=8364 RepID=A0A803K2W7_XENTR|nr:putative deoxyribonuclease tatdn3-A isoform X2 [Xenopus tropicalis]KAE8600523.1 hypothetical protein XENTR_v10013294 [Xenopus tropicalis]